MEHDMVAAVQRLRKELSLTTEFLFVGMATLCVHSLPLCSAKVTSRTRQPVAALSMARELNRDAHRIVASCTARAHARSYSSRLIHSSIVCGSFCPAPKVTVGTPWRTIQFASSPPLATRMLGLPPPADTAAAARCTTGSESFMRNGK